MQLVTKQFLLMARRILKVLPQIEVPMYNCLHCLPRFLKHSLWQHRAVMIFSNLPHQQRASLLKLTIKFGKYFQTSGNCIVNLGKGNCFGIQENWSMAVHGTRLTIKQPSFIFTDNHTGRSSIKWNFQFGSFCVSFLLF